MAKKIMVVDDEPAILIALDERLTFEGYEVLQALNGAQALDMLRGNKPDCVLLDIMMPGMNGVEVFHEIRKDPGMSTTPVIFVSVLSPHSQDASIQADTNCYLIRKPFELEMLVDMIKELIGD